MSELPLDSKMHKQHSKHPDNHPLRKDHDHHMAVLRMSGVYLLAIIFLAFLLGIMTDAPFGIVMLAFAPSYILALSVIGFAHDDHLDLRHLILVLIVLLIVVGVWLNFASANAEVFALMFLNLLLGAIFIFTLQQSYAHYHEPKLPGVVHETKPDERELSGLFTDIEDRSKSLNTAIGRTYSVYKGATPGMREKIKIPSSLYSELNADKKYSILRDHLTEISARLALLKEKESEVFTAAEHKKLNRDKKISIIDALANNEGEGILQTHASAITYVQQALKKLD